MTALYVPGTNDSDHKNQNRSLQLIGGQTSTNTDNISSIQNSQASSSGFGLAMVDGTTIVALSGVLSTSSNIPLKNAANSFTDSTPSTSPSTGALTVSGGVGIAGILQLGNIIVTNFSNAGIEHGSQNSVNTPFFDFHSSGNNIDYDCRLIASGGTASNGNGQLQFVGTTFTSAGSVVSTHPSAGVGYAVGAGGTVTQVTSRTTGVTINKITGAITLFTAAPVVGTWVTFTVTNSSVAITDTVSVSVRSGSNTYISNVSAVASGSFNISFESVSGTASDAPIINFNVIKGSNS